jgi:peptide/nickel transport system permease protein
MTRIIRAEILQIKNSNYVQISYKLGRSKFWVAKNHMAGSVVNQFAVGLILLFPHAILHSAGLTFLGFGLDPNFPSIGMLLSESMRNISTGYWWLAVFPGIALVLIIILFDLFGSNLRKMLDPRRSQE